MNKFGLDAKGNGASTMLTIRAQFITHDCADVRELDWLIGNLQKQLECLRKEGRRLFERQGRQGKITQRAPLGTKP